MHVGKRVIDDLYVHLSVVDAIADLNARRALEHAVAAIAAIPQAKPNVGKVNLRTGKVSLLAYPDFDSSPFPVLTASWSFADDLTRTPTYRTYEGSINPPILHRKELLVCADHPSRQRWLAITAAAESIGLFEDTTSIGFLLNWQRLIESKGYRLIGYRFQPLGNEVCDGLGPWSGEPLAPVQRHLTALVRNSLSAPVQQLMRQGLLTEGCSFFDYGCGRGTDVAALRAAGFEAAGWDPHFAPDHAIAPADVVNLGFVVNVIEDPAERVDAIHRAFQLARRVMAVGVMLYGSESRGTPYSDGYLTSRRTFQKYFSQSELKDLLEQVLHQQAFMVAPGIALVFADKSLEQQFNVGRHRAKGIAARLTLSRVRAPRPARRSVSRPIRLSKAAIQFAAARPLLEDLWHLCLELGRWPDQLEVPNLVAIAEQTGGLRRALRLLSVNYDQHLLAIAAQTRADDLRLYMAIQHFSKRPPYRHLETRLQRDIKSFFGDYASAQSAGLRLLIDSASPALLLSACQSACQMGIGFLEGEHSLQLHISLIDRLPAILRAYIACGLQLWDAVSEVQLVKVHIESGKLTLLEFDDFETNPLPALRQRIKVNIRKLDCEVFAYGSSAYPKPLLYRKSRYLQEDMPGYAEQLAFDQAIESIGILDQGGHGPTANALAEELEGRRRAIVGTRIVRSKTLPDLDQACGANFTFRSLIECGETQKRLGIKNLPLNPETYNSLYDLATQLLDPLIDYFGGIRLTYGFCSEALGRAIDSRIAPKLDQHAACERSASGKLICERGGAACDFIVDDEDMHEVAVWIINNLPFDRLYFYGANRPLHLSYAVNPCGAAYTMLPAASGRRIPRRFVP